MADFTTMELYIRAARVVAIMTAALVVIDSMGILMAEREKPSHQPKWSAAAWMVIGMTVTVGATYLVSNRAGLVNVTDPGTQQVAILTLWAGFAIGFTVRAASRAYRPLLVVASALGMSVAGVYFAIGPHL